VKEQRAKDRPLPTYLSDLVPVWVNTFTDGSWGFGNKGRTGLRQDGEFHKIMVGGEPSPHGLGTHARPNEGGRVAYDIGGKFEHLCGAGALADHSKSRTAISYEILGDGKSLWRSKSIRSSGIRLPFDVDVRGVHLLELVVHCPGHNHSACAVWVKPALLCNQTATKKND